MRILKSDRQDGTLSAVPTDPEDLWLLYNFIQPGDRVVTRTFRVLRVGSEDNAEKVRRSITVRIIVLKKALDLPSAKLNLTGTIELAPEDIEGVKGRSHTVSLEPGKHVTILKSSSDSIAWELLKRSRSSSNRAVIVAIEYGNAAIGIFSDAGLVEAQEIRDNISGKENPDERRKDTIEFYKHVASVLEELSSRAGGPVALVGPGFAKEEFISYLEDKHQELRSRVVQAGSSTSGTMSGVLESIKSGVLTKFLKDLRFSRESLLVEEVLKRLAQEPGTVALGLGEVSQASASGAVSHLLVLESILQEGNVDPEGLESVLTAVQKSSGEITFISPRHEGGEKLKSLGCVAALLRYTFFQRDQ